MSDNMDFGYGEVDDVVKETSSGGRFMKIELDTQYQVRIASLPRYSLRHFVNNKFFPHTGDDCDLCGKDVKPSEKVKKDAQWYWIVIDRDDNAVKVLQAPTSVARAIKALSEITNKRTGNLTWGDPQTFDIFIQKTKKSNGFVEWSVEGDPDSRGVMNAEEKALVEASGINLEEVANRSQKSENLGNYGGGGAKDLETAPESDVDPSAIPDDLGGTPSDGTVEDVADDIPF